MVEAILQIRNLVKHYGRITAVNNLTLDVPAGSVYGILGPNGSGKTTTLGIILGAVNASSGNFRWFGKEPTPELRKKVGSILEQPIFFPYLSGLQNLNIISTIKGADKAETTDVLQRVGLYERRKDKFSTYSLGMKQRLALAAALLNRPQVLILDEPTNGLDPQGIAEVRGLILAIAEAGTTIILASHLLDEVQKVCSHVLILKNGSAMFNGRVDEVLSDSDTLEVVAENMELLYETIRTHPGVKSVTRDGDLLRIIISSEVHPSEINSFLHQHNISLSHLLVKKSTLEQQFLSLLGEKTNG